MKKLFAVVLCLMLVFGSAVAEENNISSMLKDVGTKAVETQKNEIAHELNASIGDIAKDVVEVVGAESGGELSVTGTGTIRVPADVAIVSLGVRSVSADVSEMQNDMNTRIAKIREALVEMGIADDDITTGGLSIWANYDYDGDAERFVSYSGQNSLSIVVNNIDMTGDVIDAAFAAGANTLDGVSFSVKDDSEARDKAYEMAVKDAIHRAFVIVDAANTGIAGIKSISAGDVYSSYGEGRYYMKSSNMAMEDAVSTDVKASGVDVTVSVSMVFSLIGE